MSNVLQTPDKILRKALPVLHAKLNFIGSIHRDYDTQFANSGVEGKIGATLRIRLPEQYTVTTGATYVAQSITQPSVTLTVATQKHVGMKLTSADLALKDEDFMERHIIPAMSVLASSMEADALAMTKDVYNVVGTAGGGAPTTMYSWGKMRAKLNKFLAPDGGARVAMMDSDTSAAMADGLKALFNDQKALGHSFLEGFLTRGQGFSYMENDLLPYVTNGTRVASVSGTIAANPSNGATSLSISGYSAGATFLQGEVFTIPTIYAVHPETKTAYTDLQQFVVTQTCTMDGTGAGTIYFSPGLYFTADGYQNISAQVTTSNTLDHTAANGGSGTASASYQQLIGYHKDAFAFVCADLPVFDGQSFMARKAMDGLSMRIWKFADGNNDTENTRVDVLYGYKTIRPQLGVRFTK